MEHTFIHLDENSKNVSGFSRKAYQVKRVKNTVIRKWGPVSVIKRKTVWDRISTKQDTYDTIAEAIIAMQKIVRDRLAHNYRVAKAGEIPVR